MAIRGANALLATITRGGDVIDLQTKIAKLVNCVNCRDFSICCILMKETNNWPLSGADETHHSFDGHRFDFWARNSSNIDKLRRFLQNNNIITFQDNITASIYEWVTTRCLHMLGDVVSALVHACLESLFIQDNVGSSCQSSFLCFSLASCVDRE